MYGCMVAFIFHKRITPVKRAEKVRPSCLHFTISLFKLHATAVLSTEWQCQSLCALNLWNGEEPFTERQAVERFCKYLGKDSMNILVDFVDIWVFGRLHFSQPHQPRQAGREGPSFHESAP